MASNSNRVCFRSFPQVSDNVAFLIRVLITCHAESENFLKQKKRKLLTTTFPIQFSPNYHPTQNNTKYFTCVFPSLSFAASADWIPKNSAKPAPLRNCTLRPYSTLLAPHGATSNSSAASASSSSSSTSFYYGSPGSSGDMETAAATSLASSSNGATTIGQHYRESNYISTQFVKDRNVSNERTNITKFNQKSTSHGTGGSGGGGTVSRRREQIKQKNATHGYDRMSTVGLSGRISAASHRVGLTSDEADEDEEGDERGEPREVAQISSALATSASGEVAGSAASGSSSFSPSTGSFSSSDSFSADSSSLASTDDEENRRKTISNNERTSSMNLFNTVTLVEESFQSNSYSTDGSGNRLQAARTTPDANHRLAKREKRFNENLENEINKTHFDDDDEIFNSSTTGNQDEESIRTIKPGSSSSSSSSISSSAGTSTTSERNNYRSTAREAPIAAKLRSNNIRYNRYHSMETAAGATGGGGSRHTGAASYNSGTGLHSFSHYMESVEVPTTMELECVAGYDGGLPQHFFLEAYDSRTRKLRLNITSALNDVPLFRIDLSGRYCLCLVVALKPWLPCSRRDRFISTG